MIFRVCGPYLFGHCLAWPGKSEVIRRVSTSKSVFEKWFAGSTGDPPVPSGDSPDGTGATVRANGHGLFKTGSNLKDCGRGQHFEGAGQASSGTPFCRLNAAFHLATERRIDAAAKNSVVRP